MTNHSIQSTKLFAISLLCIFVTACSSPGNNADEKRANIEKMRQDVLGTLYNIKPSARDTIKNAVGYAVFSNANVYIIFASAASGYGVVVENNTDNKTYMRMAAGGLGFGAGIKDYRLVMAFHDYPTMYRFIENGWQFGAQADAAAKASEKGGAVGLEVVIDNITIYQITETGLALQVTVQGTKYWQDKSLNQ